MSPDSDFSAVITSFGVGNRVERAVESIKNQTLPGIDLVVVDDASQDAETLQSLKELEPHVRIERLAEQRGVGNARNVGLALTNGPYVLCLDGDDWVEPRYLELAKTKFDSDPAVGIVSAWVRFEGQRQGEWRPEEFGLEDILATNQIQSASTFRRSASESVNSYNAELGGYEDWEHWISIVAAGWTTRVIAESLIHYEIRPDSLSRRSNRHARQLVEFIVGLHEGLYHSLMGPIFSAKVERAIFLEREIEKALERCEELEEEIASISTKNDS